MMRKKFNGLSILIGLILIGYVIFNIHWMIGTFLLGLFLCVGGAAGLDDDK